MKAVRRRRAPLWMGLLAVAACLLLGLNIWRPRTARAEHLRTMQTGGIPRATGTVEVPKLKKQTWANSSVSAKAPKKPTAKRPAGIKAKPTASPPPPMTPQPGALPEHFQQLREVVRHSERPRAKLAFSCVISNEKYLDGAVTMGWSIQKHSEFIKAGKADLVIIINELLHNNSIELLIAVGWNYVKVLRTLAHLSPKSYFTYTFDKIYLFGMTEYDRVVFFDADMLCLSSPDAMFDTKLPSPKWVGAIGGGSYFQTGTMVVQPSWEVFEDLYREYRYGAFNYNQWRARDGILCRNYFGTRHVMFPSTGLYHYSGYFKPWFNKDHPPARSEKYPDFGPYYQKWWKTYEELHIKVLIPFWNGRSPYGGYSTLNCSVTPYTHMWLQRYAKMNYTRKLSRAIAAETNLTFPGLRLLKGKECSSVCAGHGLVCHEDALQWWSVNGCPTLTKEFGCKECLTAVTKDWTPGMEGGNCHTNFLHDVRFLPRCNATAQGEATRLCPCVLPKELHAMPTLLTPANIYSVPPCSSD